MKKLICFIIGHKIRQACLGSVIFSCNRCRKVSDFTRFVAKTQFNYEYPKEEVIQ